MNIKNNKYLLCIIIFFAILIFIFQCNPFAPALNFDNPSSTTLTGDQTTVEGVFQNFKYAYVFRDTVLYGKLLANDFIFIYRDYERAGDFSWGRDEEMQITNRLFQNCQNLDLVWNNIFAISGDSTRINVVKFFNLSITFNPSDIVRLDGKVNLTLTRPDPSHNWEITSWRDESNF